MTSSYFVFVITCIFQCNYILAQNYVDENIVSKLKEEMKSMNISTLNSEIPKPEYNDISNYRAGLLNKDLYLNFTQLVTKYGFPVQTYEIHTKDGYILTIFRIPCGGTPVFLMPGIFSSPDDFIIAGPESAIAYSLAYDGFDVWVGSPRGHKYSRRHEVLLPDVDEKFWDYSFNEIGLIDVPTIIDFVLKTTGHEQLMYVGHSQGNTACFVMCSELPEYNKKITVMVALAPVVWMSHIKSPVFRALAPFSNQEYYIARIIGLNEVFASNAFTRTASAILCGNGITATLICINALFPILGYDYAQLNFTNLPNIFQHSPTGSSTKEIVHYFQEYNSGKFRKFDYGVRRNLQIYGTTSPPSYHIEHVTVPVALIYSENDWLSDVIDVNTLRRNLTNVVSFYRVPFDKFNHIDYYWAKDVKQLVYYQILNTLNHYNSAPTNKSSLCPTL